MSQRNSLSLREKLKIIELIENKTCSVTAIQKKYKCGKTQVYSVLKRKNELRKERDRGVNMNIKRKVPKTGNEEINALTWDWFVATRAKNVPISGPMVQEQAKKIAEKLGNMNFKASNGWLESFKGRHEIVWNSACRKSNDLDINIVDKMVSSLVETAEKIELDETVEDSTVSTYKKALKHLKILENLSLRESDCCFFTMISNCKHYVENKILQPNMNK